VCNVSANLTEPVSSYDNKSIYKKLTYIFLTFI
jgi:hypothetical protein